ncbi:DUF2786 domain-containing protein [Pseudomonas coronafaciens]|uniref:DUF2786 domain-containing protein n=1 Tax=Pseudomonas coronafaciens pv. coronafaciens TaxID=235275 RepID=A0AAE6UNU1_9PSED|nr:DUF2786 domain-containing protein [Pseudomonas coronafaciens]QGT82961.1 DUF2786 domain-containing protein [Pseudomonas coronafaciens pv. coronafaciens]
MSEKLIDPKKLERAIRKIKHCLALSQSSNENEAATAMRQAQALMREYHLSETDVKVSDVGEAKSSMSRAARRPVWDQHLSAVVAEVFNVKALRYTHWCDTKKNRVERAKFVGVSPAQHIALYAYETLLAKLTKARNAYIAEVRTGIHRSNYSARTAGDHFAIAWVFAVQSKLKQLVPRGEENKTPEHKGAGPGLVAVEAQHQALIDTYLADKQVGKARKVRGSELDLNAQIAGMLAGTKVDLHAGLANGAEHAPVISTSA